MFDVEPKRSGPSSMAHIGRADLASEAELPPAQTASTTAAGSPIKVIYIAGYGRSGTTLLDIALSQAADVMGAGEMSTLARHVWDNREFCACGKAVPDCEVWSSIVERWLQSQGTPAMAAHRRRQPWREALLGPGRLLDRLRPHARAAYGHETLQLFREVTHVTGRPIVVDSSKLPGRGLALAAIPGIELYVVHMVRDGRGVVWSLRKPYKRDVEKGLQRDLNPKPLFYAALRWMSVNLAAEKLCGYVGPHRSLRIRYEDFVAAPEETVAAILSLVRGAPVGSRVLPESGALEPWHQMAGSRHRMQRTIRVREDGNWKQVMPADQQRWVTRLCGRLLRRYGYLEQSA
ncbi:sulfotransferase [Novosphingobium sp. M1R2S20]|uniref:Sulfotransferase n=1 Tax=Novosphingobium rhizovicinum TaxID=3228928 RepID=A0ABV3RG04_9SPHN